MFSMSWFSMSCFSMSSIPVMPMLRRVRLPYGLVLLLALHGGMFGLRLTAQSSTAAAAAEASDTAKPDKLFHSPAERMGAIQTATLVLPHDVSATDMQAGPGLDHGKLDLRPNDKVTCDFAEPGVTMGGRTPKFSCRITRVEHSDGRVETIPPDAAGKPVKIKFGADDNELYAEVAATRLMWSLGYPADQWTPVQVECHNCPENPVSGKGAVGTHTFAAATTVWKYPGHKIYEAGKETQGWSWKELDSNGRPLYERDGLKLMAAFLQHSDNKPPQQRLSCDKIAQDATGTKCGSSLMMVQDLGATFGGGGWFTSNSTAKMNLKEWSGKKLFGSAGTEGSPRSCKAVLRKSLTASGGLGDPAISEEGRRFDAGLLCQLSDQQIAEMFRVSRVALMPTYHNADGSFRSGQSEDAIVAQWTEAFKHRREELASARCEWKERPADLAPIDNPAGLAKVANFCAAKPF